MYKKIFITIIAIFFSISALQVQPDFVNNPTRMSINGTIHQLLSYEMQGTESVLFKGDNSDTLKAEQEYAGGTLISLNIFNYENDNLKEIITGMVQDSVWTMSSITEYNYNTSSQVIKSTNKWYSGGEVFSSSKQVIEYKNNLPYKLTKYSNYSDTASPSSISVYEYLSSLVYNEYQTSDITMPDSFSYMDKNIYSSIDVQDSIISYTNKDGQWKISGINYYPTEYSDNKILKFYNNSVSIDNGINTISENGTTTYQYIGDTVFIELKAFPYFSSDTTIINYKFLNTGKNTIDISDLNLKKKHVNFNININDNYLSVNFKKVTLGKTTISFTDLKGRIMKKVVCSNHLSSITSINISDLAKGNYLLKVENSKIIGVTKVNIK